MAPVVFHLTSLKSGVEAFISALESLPPSERPLWVASCHHWLHEPHLSAEDLMGSGEFTQVWDHVVVFRSPSHVTPELPAVLQPYLALTWSITADVQDSMIDSLSSRKAEMAADVIPSLPIGWSADNHEGIDAAKASPGVEISLETSSRAFGSDKFSNGHPLKAIIRDVGLAHPGPVVMLNLLAYLPNQRSRYMEYVAAFQKTIGPKYGGQPLLVGFGVLDWSSRAAEKVDAQHDGEWEDVALVWYPSGWHFGKMIDDPVYVGLDRQHKGGILRDNPLLYCTELNLA
ncbi:Fc.00g072810.m01.CDS01 [Cosmosporella sp. VM-42]